MTRDEIVAGAERLGPWYHAIELFPGYRTPSYMVQHNQPYWDMVRDVRASLVYKAANVLDMGSFTGMWAFEAEHLGAMNVVAGDIYQGFNRDATPYGQFMFAKQALNSRVLLVPNCDAHKLVDRLHDPMRMMGIVRFDIVQCLGLLYHVENPSLVLDQIRSVMGKGDQMLLETAVWTGGGEEPVMRNNCDHAIYVDDTTLWVPNFACLIAMLKAAHFSIQQYQFREQVGRPSGRRYCLIANAI